MQWKASGPVLDVNDMCFVKNEIEKSKLPKALNRGTTTEMIFTGTKFAVIRKRATS